MIKVISPLFAAIFLSAILMSGPVPAAAQDNPKAQPPEDVLKITTELVQTGVTVVDKDGKFVEGLKPEQFEVKVDGKPQVLQAVDKIRLGSNTEQKLLSRSSADVTTEIPVSPTAAANERQIIFFLDDLHLSADSLNRAKLAINYFMENQMAAGDQVAILSATGRVGFLQQFTDQKAVLKAALDRITPITTQATDTERPPMSEYVAIKIEHGDSDALGFYTDEVIKGYNTKNATMINIHGAQEVVRTRAHQIVLAVEGVTASTLSSLNSFMRSAATVPGRKLVFFISDGFYLDAQKSASSATDRLRMVIDTAARNGIVVYSIDAKGLVSGAPDATNQRPSDSTGRLDRASVGEVILSQDGLNALARDTGGRALRNTNYFDTWITKNIEEVSNYYLVAWKPEEGKREDKFKKLQVSVVGRPDLTVRVAAGFVTSSTKTSSKTANSTPSSTPGQGEVAAVDAGLKKAIGSFLPVGGVPVALSSSFVDAPGTGPILTASMQVPVSALVHDPAGKIGANVDIAGVVLNDQGKQVAGFKTALNVKPVDAARGDDSNIIYNYKTKLSPGLYQIRIAARDRQSGRAGSALRWIEIPDLSQRKFTLSSLHLSEEGAKSVGKSNDGAAESQVQFSVDNKFRRTSTVQFFVFAYNATRTGPGAVPAVMAQVKILKDGKEIGGTPERPLTIEKGGDLDRLFYAGTIRLGAMQPGRYGVQVNLKDTLAGKSASRTVMIDVE
jgi:VWFA-related protein